MFLFKPGQMVAEQSIAVFVADHQRRTLAKTCFRAHQEPKAGSFVRWATAEQLFHDQRVKALFSERVAQAILARKDRLSDPRNSAYESFTIDVGRPIGWSATAPIGDFEPSELELRTLKKRSLEMGVRPNCRRHAPLTNEVSFLCHLRAEYTKRYGNEWKAIIFNIATGAHVGDKQGNIADSSKLAFFSWNHPGEPLRR